MPHPLEPLSADEVARAIAAARAADGLAIVRFLRVRLAEPDKAAVLAHLDGAPAPARLALVAVVDEERRIVHATVDLGTDAVVAIEAQDGARPPITPDEYAQAGAAARRSPALRAALERRGVDPDRVHYVTLSAGAFDHPLEAAHRIARVVCYEREQEGSNSYARPVESLIGFIDLDALEILELEEADVKPRPAADGAYDAGVVPLRSDLTPIEIGQPQGVSFSIDGSRIAWHRWTFGARIDAQEGLVLDDVRYDGRRVLYRGSCPEMIVPYGEPHPMHAWRTYFDAGEYGLGDMLNSLELGCDCIGEIRYLDAHLVDHAGDVRTVRNAICLHEEDAGLLFKHFDDVTGRTELRRNRRFVVNAMATVGNYDYAFRWYLGLDGSIEVEVQLHGVVSTMALAPGEEPRGSNLVDRGLAAPHHQHLFCFRLDLDVDGTRNRIVEVEAEPVPMGAASPLGNVFAARRTPLASERAARREADDRAARSWHVQSTERKNGLGGPTAYRLTPLHGTSTLLAQPGSSVARRAGYAAHTFWATAYDPAELHPASQYPYQQRDTNGLPQWSDADRSLDDADVVVWYVAGSTHFVRPEDWPIMPVQRVGFLLEPYGFFDRNPTLDVPPPHAHCAHRNGDGA